MSLDPDDHSFLSPDSLADSASVPDSEKFSIGLTFIGVECPACGQICDPGVCPACGAGVPAVEMADELTHARTKALGPLAAEARDLLESFDTLPKGRVPVTLDQFVACVDDSELFSLVGQVGKLGHSLGQLDLDDPKIVGSRARQAVIEGLEQVRALREIATELCAFEPGGPAEEFQALAVESGRHGARIVNALLRAVTAQTIADGRDAQAELQDLLSEFPAIERSAALRPKLDDWAVPDDDGRIALALGREGQFTDEFGLLVPDRIFAAYSEEDQPLEALGRAGAHYFQRTLGPAAVSASGAAAILALPAVNMATLDRPLLAHRVARLLYDLLGRAWARDSANVRLLFERVTDQAPTILSASSRIQKSFRLILLGAEMGEADDEAAVAQAMTAYREVAETAYRTLGSMILDLERLLSGVPVSHAADAPTLGPLVEQLASATEHVARELATACDGDLRNAGAHSQYRWDAEAEEIHDVKTGQRWNLATLSNRMDSLVAAVAGADAAWSCFVVARDLEIEQPSWVADGSAPEAVQLVASLSFGVRGLVISEVRDGGATVVVEPPDLVDTSLVGPLASMSTVVRGATSYRLVSSVDDTILLEIDAQIVAQARDATSELKDLMVLETTLSAMINGGQDRLEAVAQIAAVMTKVVAVSSMQELSTDQSSLAFTRVRHRLEYASNLCSRWNATNTELDRLRRRLDEAVASARMAPRDRGALERFVAQVRGLVDWAETQGVSWPPSLRRQV